MLSEGNWMSSFIGLYQALSLHWLQHVKGMISAQSTLQSINFIYEKMMNFIYEKMTMERGVEFA